MAVVSHGCATRRGEGGLGPAQPAKRLPPQGGGAYSSSLRSPVAMQLTKIWACAFLLAALGCTPKGSGDPSIGFPDARTDSPDGTDGQTTTDGNDASTGASDAGPTDDPDADETPQTCFRNSEDPSTPKPHPFSPPGCDANECAEVGGECLSTAGAGACQFRCNDVSDCPFPPVGDCVAEMECRSLTRTSPTQPTQKWCIIAGCTKDGDCPAGMVCASFSDSPLHCVPPEGGE